MNLKFNRQKLNNYCKNNNISYLALFGSHARGENNINSDVDLLVSYNKTPGLLRHIGIERELSENIFLKKKVDLVTKKSLNKYIAPYVEEDLVTLYES